jgi:FixJ family two-component response regulator
LSRLSSAHSRLLSPGSCNEAKRVVPKCEPEETIVYFVSDDPVGTRRLTELFVSKGLRVACFTTAAEYIVAQRDERPACLILDLILPDLDGLEIQSKLVGRGAPPIIFVAVHGDPTSVVRAMRLQSTGSMRKSIAPFE